MAYSNSPLVQYTKISPNKTTSNRMPIDRITIHHAAGNILVESMGEMFARATQRSSSNYGIGTNGKIAMYVEEAHSSWCSSSTANDRRAITIEVANSSNTDSNWPVSDAALQSTIKLCADICKRNGKNKMVYLETATKTNAYNQKSNEMLLTRHDFYKVKCCPGPYLGSKLSYIVSEVNKILGSGSTTVSGTITATSSEPSSVGTGITDAIRANMKYAKLTDKNGTLIKVPDGLGTINTYMHWQKIKSDSLQKDLRTAAGMKFDANGYGKIDDRYVIAMTDTFGQVGDMVDICRDGSVLKGIIGDIKDQTTAHGTPANKWGHSDGKSIVEFIVDEKVVKSQTHINETDPGKNKGAVLHVENKGNWFLKHQNDPAPTTSTSTSTSTSSGKFPYLVRVTDASLNIRKGPGTNYPVIGTITDKGVYTIVAESTGTGAKLWGQLKPVMGNGWISLGFTTPV